MIEYCYFCGKPCHSHGSSCSHPLVSEQRSKSPVECHNCAGKGTIRMPTWVMKCRECQGLGVNWK